MYTCTCIYTFKRTHFVGYTLAHDLVLKIYTPRPLHLLPGTHSVQCPCAFTAVTAGMPALEMPVGRWLSIITVPCSVTDVSVSDSHPIDYSQAE